MYCAHLSDMDQPSPSEMAMLVSAHVTLSQLVDAGANACVNLHM